MAPLATVGRRAAAAWWWERSGVGYRCRRGSAAVGRKRLSKEGRGEGGGEGGAGLAVVAACL